MILTDESNLLETGVDIMVQPPGKKLGNILLLSAGEKALTAISLLFAIFRYNPSPSACWTRWTPPWTIITSRASLISCGSFRSRPSHRYHA